MTEALTLLPCGVCGGKARTIAEFINIRIVCENWDVHQGEGFCVQGPHLMILRAWWNQAQRTTARGIQSCKDH